MLFLLFVFHVLHGFLKLIYVVTLICSTLCCDVYILLSVVVSIYEVDDDSIRILLVLLTKGTSVSLMKLEKQLLLDVHSRILILAFLFLEL